VHDDQDRGRNLPSGSYKKLEEGKQEEHVNFVRKKRRTRRIGWNIE
jgi:hypothetical protein